MGPPRIKDFGLTIAAAVSLLRAPPWHFEGSRPPYMIFNAERPGLGPA